MVTAEITISKEQLIGFNQPMQYIGIDWETYKAISEELSDSISPQLTFEKGVLTVMPTSPLHEVLIRLMETLMTMVRVGQKIKFIPTGSLTLRSISKQIAVEPDLSFYVTNANRYKAVDYVTDELETPPDIVVEIDIHHKSDPKFHIYSALIIPEFWLYDGETFEIYKLQDDGSYKSMSHSTEVPVMTSLLLTEFLARGRTEEEQSNIISEFEELLASSRY